MPRPENVKCETCVFWIICDGRPSQCIDEGSCHLKPCTERKLAIGFCRHWSDTWPGEKPVPPPEKPVPPWRPENVERCQGCKKQVTAGYWDRRGFHCQDCWNKLNEEAERRYWPFDTNQQYLKQEN